MSNLLFTAVSVEQQEIVAGGRRRRDAFKNDQSYREYVNFSFNETNGRHGASTVITLKKGIKSDNKLEFTGNLRDLLSAV